MRMDRVLDQALILQQIRECSAWNKIPIDLYDPYSTGKKIMP